MAQIVRIGATDIEEALSGVTRQYLVGKLGRPQALRHIPHDVVEIGVTRYGPQGGTEAPHTHRQAFEYQYMLEGKTVYLDVTAREEHVFRKGDFYAIEPGVVYAQKSAPHTKILFIKVPPGNDKVPVAATSDVEAWLNNPIVEE
jgi:quercetin dioxygenase-like cupin family protein